MLIQGMKGLGDNIYQRAFVRSVAGVAPGAVVLETPWPEIYSDLDVRFARSSTSLRTQAKNVARQPHERWVRPGSQAEHIVISYGSVGLRKGTIASEMRNCFKCDPMPMDLPDFGAPPVTSDKPIAFIRPVTTRAEWTNTARSPLPEYVLRASQALRAAGFYVVSVADLMPGQEWLDGGPPEADLYLHNGELTITEMLALLQHAAVAVGGVGWLVPASIAMQKRTLCILGGNGMHNAPVKIADPVLGPHRITWATPDNYCQCADMRHRCKKTITNFDKELEEWVRAVSTT